MKRRIGICLLGVLLSFLLFAIFIQINGSLTQENEGPVERLAKTIWRIDYLFCPAVVAIIALVVGLLDRSRYKLVLVAITLLPFIVSQLASSSFSGHGWLLSSAYLTIAFVVTLLIPKQALR